MCSLLLAIFTFVVFGIIISQLNIRLASALPFWEARTIYWVRIFAAIIASVIIIRLSTMLIIISHKKHLILGSIILLIVVTSVSSTLVRVDFWTRYSTYGISGEGATTISPEELAALSYLKCNDSPYGQVLTLTETSWTYIKYYSGIPNVFNRPSLFFDTAQSTFLLQAIATQSYIYIAAHDQSILNKYSNGYLKNYVLPYLPVVFNNSAVTIYEVPKI